MGSIVTITDVAYTAGVSISTVSRYLNDRTLLHRDTAQRIQEVICELNYIPNASARNLAMRQTGRIGVLVSCVRSAYWTEVYGAIHDYISQCSDDLEIFSLNCDELVLYRSKKSIRDKIRVLAEQRVVGIILLLREVSREDIDYMDSLGIPFVIVQSDLHDDERVSYVNIDNRAASYDITKYLLDLGHKLIAYNSGPTEAVFARERFEGYQDAMKSRQLYNKNLIISGNNTTSDGYWRTKQILSWTPRPTAILYGCDAMAFGGMQAIHELGLSIPGDMSVAGFDGIREQIEIMDMLPPLTTIVQPMSKIGEKAAEIILQQIKNQNKDEKSRYSVVLPTGFVDNGSCMPLRTSILSRFE